MSTLSVESQNSLQKKIAKALRTKPNEVISSVGSSRGTVGTATRMFIEGVHFDLSYTNPWELGQKLLAITSSELAVAGIRPTELNVSMGTRQDTHDFFVVEFFRGMAKLARKLGVTIRTTHVTASPSFLTVNLTCFGKNASGKGGGRIKPGNLIAVRGTLGDSIAGLNSLKKIGRENLHNWESLLTAHLCPKDQVETALSLRKLKGVTSICLLKNGLASDLNALCSSRKIGAVVNERGLPISKATRWAARALNNNFKHWSLYGGEDYGLLITLDPKLATKLLKKFKLTIIGEVRTQKEAVRFAPLEGKPVPLLPRNWHDFVRRSSPAA